jgi:hypothetical protein
MNITLGMHSKDAASGFNLKEDCYIMKSPRFGHSFGNI